MVNEELGEEGIKKYYKYNFEVYSNQKYEKAIVEGLEGYIFPLYTTVPLGSMHVKQLMFYDSKTWEYIGVVR